MIGNNKKPTERKFKIVASLRRRCRRRRRILCSTFTLKRQSHFFFILFLHGVVLHARTVTKLVTRRRDARCARFEYQKKKKVVEFKFDLFITQIEKDVSAYPIKGLGARQQTRVNCRLEENREAVFNFSRVTFALLLL